MREELIKQQQEYQARKADFSNDNRVADRQLAERYLREDELMNKKTKDKANAIEEIKKWRQDYVSMKQAQVQKELQQRITEEIENNKRTLELDEREKIVARQRQKSKLDILREDIMAQQLYKANIQNQRGPSLIEEKKIALKNEQAIDWETVNRNKD